MVEALGITDELTGLYNAGYFRHRLAEEVERIRRYGGALTLVAMDMDHYPEMISRDGENKAQTALQRIARALAQRTRTSDIRARWDDGGIMIACVGTSLAQASWLAEALRESLAEVQAPVSRPLTCSFGVAELQEGDTAGTLTSRASRLLADAMAGGGDNVLC